MSLRTSPASSRHQVSPQSGDGIIFGVSKWEPSSLQTKATNFHWSFPPSPTDDRACLLLHRRSSLLLPLGCAVADVVNFGDRRAAEFQSPTRIAPNALGGDAASSRNGGGGAYKSSAGWVNAEPSPGEARKRVGDVSQAGRRASQVPRKSRASRAGDKFWDPERGRWPRSIA